MVRVKHRYLIAHYLPNTPTASLPAAGIKSRDIQQSLRDKIQELYGDMGSGEYGQNTMVKYVDEVSHVCVIRMPKEAQIQVHFALSCLQKVKDADVIFHSVAIKSCSRTCMQALGEVLTRVYAQIYVDEVEARKALEAVQHTLTLLDL